MSARNLAATGIALVVLSGIVCANAGVPMLAIVWPASWILLFPVIAAEAWIARRITGLSLSQGLRASALANAASTLIALPVTWGVVTLAGGSIRELWSPEFGSRTYLVLDVVFRAGWLEPIEDELDWMVPAAALVLLVPFYFASVACELFVFSRVTGCSREIAFRWSWRANLATYLSIGLLVLGRLAVVLLDRAA